MCSNIEGSATEGSVNAMSCQFDLCMITGTYINIYTTVKKGCIFLRPNLSKLQCVLLFAKVEARGVGSDTNKHSRREKQN